MPMEEKAAYAHADAALTALVSWCLLQPTMDLAEEVQSETLVPQFEEILATHPNSSVQDALSALRSFQKKTQGLQLNDARLMLETDYNRLFVGPGKLLAVPYESFYETTSDSNGRGRLRGPAEREVIAFYREHGYQMPEHFVDFADHIAIELEFLAALAANEANAWEAGDEERAETLREAADAFRKKHPGRFIAQLATDIRNGAKREFYPAIATIVEQAILN